MVYFSAKYKMECFYSLGLYEKDRKLFLRALNEIHNCTNIKLLVVVDEYNIAKLCKPKQESV